MNNMQKIALKRRLKFLCAIRSHKSLTSNVRLVMYTLTEDTELNILLTGRQVHQLVESTPCEPLGVYKNLLQGYQELR